MKIGILNIYNQYIEILNKPENIVTKNVVIMLATVATMIISIALLSILTKPNKSKLITIEDVKSNKLVRFLEVTLFVILLTFLANLFVELYNIYLTTIGVLIILFAFYSRVSNKDRRTAYLSFVTGVAFYLVIRLFQTLS